ncbi:peptidylprolyl isomerase [Amylibacter sp. SFDW26]|uniref:peptidylprolyl isomerase n=1 Tax=Amylibacter sp. SFDW26 TaxID=2652722 RepID=UPI001261BEC5|nr:peptidylprolyl isomerase [Amylibacter sp. SFDW26]KAB7615818.1 peptidylprolyl isomerase [Amylibacter sp. SFDW26]
MKKTSFLICGMLAGFAFTSPTLAGIYSPILQVNESVVTQFELNQRIAMLRAFGSQIDVPEQARTQLIEDRLRMQAAKDAGITTNEEDVLAGMDEFAARGNFTAEQLLQYLRQRGVERETFASFVRAGIAWRNVIGSRFASKVNIADEEIDARLGDTAIDFPKTVNVAEIILPFAERGDGPTRALADRLSETIKNEQDFTAAARKHSKSPTASNGGNVGWVPLGNLPPQVAARISQLQPGQMTAPVSIGSAIALYQLRGIREAKSASEQVLAVSYMQVAIPKNKGAQSGQIAEATKLINAGDTCLDMQSNAAGFGEGAITSYTFTAPEIPARIGAELARLDKNEATYFITETGNVNVLMLCNRAKDIPEGARENIRNALFSQRVGSFGDGYLQELRSDATIIER